MARGFWTRVEPGTLKKRVTFYRQADVEDSLGKLTNGIQKVITLWADFYPVRGSEFYEIQKIQGKVTHKCYCRFHSALKDIDSNWFIGYQGNIYHIESAIDAGYAGRYYEIYCTEYTNKEDMPTVVETTPDEDGADNEHEEETQWTE